MSHRHAQSGFTLIELLVVLAIIAAIAGVGVQALGRVSEQSRHALARAEMDNIASAIQRFRADTGYWPKQGPFAQDCAVDGDGNAIAASPAHLGQLRTPAYFPVSDTDPTCDTDNPILPYDVRSGTGWNGPYVRELDAVWVTMGVNLAADGAGDPSLGSTQNLRGLGDPYTTDADGVYFVWTDGDEYVIARLGRPYLYFIEQTDIAPDDGINDEIAPCQVPCLVSFGPDGVFDHGSGDDIVVNIAGH